MWPCIGFILSAWTCKTPHRRFPACSSSLSHIREKNTENTACLTLIMHRGTWTWHLSNRWHVCRLGDSTPASAPSPLTAVLAGSSTGGIAPASLRGFKTPHKCTSNGSCHEYCSRDAVEISPDAVPHELARRR